MSADSYRRSRITHAAALSFMDGTRSFVKYIDTLSCEAYKCLSFQKRYPCLTQYSQSSTALSVDSSVSIGRSCSKGTAHRRFSHSISTNLPYLPSSSGVILSPNTQLLNPGNEIRFSDPFHIALVIVAKSSESLRTVRPLFPSKTLFRLSYGLSCSYLLIFG
jgi:hypothetical protein